MRKRTAVRWERWRTKNETHGDVKAENSARPTASVVGPMAVTTKRREVTVIGAKLNAVAAPELTRAGITMVDPSPKVIIAPV